MIIYINIFIITLTGLFKERAGKILKLGKNLEPDPTLDCLIHLIVPT